MISAHSKFSALLLSLMLALLPLQSAFAADITMHMQGNSFEMNAMSSMDHAQMPDLASDCSQCEQDENCCVGNSCSAEHCASCSFAAVLQASLSDDLIPVANDESVADSVFPDSTLSSLFRPPRV
jgi:hypothetical protein